MSHVPTSVAVITATTGGEPAGMTVGTFTSVSLDPPLVAFYVDLGSTTWPVLAEAEYFGINILGSGCGEVCRAFSRRGQDRFAGVAWKPSERGVPLLEDAIVTVECSPHRVDRIGDHLQVVGEVEDLIQQSIDEPLIFLRGGFVDMSAIAGRAVDA
ncbi:flavin reductase family protein [Rhodococcus sp. NPDC019627]|uniref:flavin reductase family protein n=1 Tax=unclassified Rhodococcus (in: high G+C Gram-positive bacteria) TaxID=192944 RepID=UPI0033C69892